MFNNSGFTITNGSTHLWGITLKDIWICDIEANGLMPEVDTIWCIVIRSLNEAYLGAYCDNESNYDCLPISEFKDFYLDDQHTLIFHNAFGYDLPVLNKVLGLPIDRPNVYDTLVMSRALDPDRTFGHSVKNWGKHLKMDKVENEQWSEWNPLILERCIQDVLIQEAIYKELLKEEETNKLLFKKMHL